MTSRSRAERRKKGIMKPEGPSIAGDTTEMIDGESNSSLPSPPRSLAFLHTQKELSWVNILEMG